MIALAKKLKPIQRAMDGDGWVWPERRWLDATSPARRSAWSASDASAARSRAWRRRLSHARARPTTRIVRQADAAADSARMLAESDFVSVHCVLNRETRDLIGEASCAR